MGTTFTALKQGFGDAGNHNAGLLAAGIAYYTFLAFMPLLAAIVLTYGLVVDPTTLATHMLELAETLPGSAAGLIEDQLAAVVEDRGSAKGLGLVVALSLSLFAARVAAGAVITAMNVAFGAEEDRGFIKSNLLALAITLGAVVAMGLVGAATTLVSTVLSGSGGAFTSYAVVGLAGIAGAMIAYRLVPNTDHISLRAALRGSILFALGWMIASAGFGFYVANFGNYNATYGSLGAIIVLLTWLYLSAYLLLLGAHFAAASDEAGAIGSGS
ncbi:MAG: YihY/virulence factor BrkB family protein [Erythrobacter sp.]|jgi:membrane protein|nr:YihY/virulence factor BrkB family protein [Erythrobacter sp.]